MNDELTLPERMVYEAQNNQMIDSHFLEAGNLLNEGADEIKRLRDSLDKALGFRVDLKDSSSGSALDALDAMIDQRGKERDDEIERLREHVAELEKALRLLRDTVHEIAEWEELDGFAEAYDMCRALAEIIGGEDD